MIDTTDSRYGTPQMDVTVPPIIPPTNPSIVFDGDILRIHSGTVVVAAVAFKLAFLFLILPNIRPTINAPVSVFHTINRIDRVLANDEDNASIAAIEDNNVISVLDNNSDDDDGVVEPLLFLYLSLSSFVSVTKLHHARNGIVMNNIPINQW